jgi:hypothetical protein
MDEVVDFRRKAYAVGAVATACIVIAIAVTAIPHPGVRLEYDPTLVTGGIVGIVVTWAGIYAALAYKATHATLNYQRERDETTTRRRRQASAEAMEVATAKLVDTLVALADTGNPLRGERSLRHPVLDSALASAELFTRITVHRLAAVIGEVTALLAAIDHYWGEVSEWETRNNAGRSGVEPKNRPIEQAAIKERAKITIEAIRLLQVELTNELRDQPLESPAPIWGHGSISLPAKQLRPTGIVGTTNGVSPADERLLTRPSNGD